MEQEKNKGAADYTVVPVTISSIPAIELSMVEKVMLCKIVSLSKGRPCNMSNMAFASCFGISTRQVTEHIKALTEKGWIDARRPSVRERHVWPTPKTLALYDEWARAKGNLREETFKREPSRRNPPSRGNLQEETRNSDRGNPLTDNIENIKSIDICANQDLHKQTSRSQSTRKKFVPPSLDEVKQYVAKKKLAIDARRFFDFYTAGEWHDSSGKPVQSWKQKALTWDRREQKERKSKPPASGPVVPTAADLERRESERQRQLDENMNELLERMKQEGEIEP